MAYINKKTNISKEKIDILKNLSAQIKDLPPEQAILKISQTNQMLSSKNMSFTQSELNEILDNLLATMPENTKNKVAFIRTLISP